MGVSATPITPVDAFTTNTYPPESGTPVLAADVEIGEQALVNRTEYLKNRLGEYALYAPSADAHTDASFGVYYTNATATFTDTGVGTSIAIGTIAENDLVEVRFTGLGKANTSCGSAQFRLMYKNAAAAWVQVPGQLTLVNETEISSPFSFSYWIQFTAAAMAVPVKVRLEGKATIAAGTGAQLLDVWSVSLTRWKLIT